MQQLVLRGADGDYRAVVDVAVPTYRPTSPGVGVLISIAFVGLARNADAIDWYRRAVTDGASPTRAQLRRLRPIRAELEADGLWSS
jgi:hypothetical protein